MGHHPPNIVKGGKGKKSVGKALVKTKKQNVQRIKIKNLVCAKPLNVKKAKLLERRLRYAKDDAEKALLKLVTKTELSSLAADSMLVDGGEPKPAGGKGKKGSSAQGGGNEAMLLA